MTFLSGGHFRTGWHCKFRLNTEGNGHTGCAVTLTPDHQFRPNAEGEFIEGDCDLAANGHNPGGLGGDAAVHSGGVQTDSPSHSKFCCSSTLASSQGVGSFWGVTNTEFFCFAYL